MDDFIIIELYEALLDNNVRPDLSTKVELELINSTGIINIKDLNSEPRSSHEFKLNAEDIGFGRKHNLNESQACIILEISLSLSNNRIIFTTLQPNQSYPVIKFGKLPSDVEIIDITGGKRIVTTGTLNFTGNLSMKIRTKVTLDENKIFEIINKLLKFKIFKIKNRTLYDFNIIDSIKRYTDAINSVNSINFYTSLYSAFEKAINADMERKGVTFNNAAYNLIGMNKKEMAELREIYNRIKHTQRNRKDITFLKNSESRLQELVIILKKAADNAILNRIN